MNPSLLTTPADRPLRAAFGDAVRDVAPVSDLGAVVIAATLAGLTATAPPEGVSRVLFGMLLLVPILAYGWPTGRIGTVVTRTVGRAGLPFIAAGLMYWTVVAQRPDLGGGIVALLVPVVGTYAGLVAIAVGSLTLIHFSLRRLSRATGTEVAGQAAATHDDGA
ncbi:MAG: hypothetical protein M3R38_01435 [Actinomycetota bacterium]|nr:hypothetical protein [Actinomycetota bacterium]